VLPVQAMKAYRGRIYTAPLILNLGPRWMILVKFVARTINRTMPHVAIQWAHSCGLGPIPGLFMGWHIASISYDTACEVALPTGFLLNYILERACIAVETPRGHWNSGCVVLWNCDVFPRCATKSSLWICCYIKQYFTVGVDYLQKLFTNYFKIYF
jgi:hypothetical protein